MEKAISESLNVFRECSPNSIIQFLKCANLTNCDTIVHLGFITVIASFFFFFFFFLLLSN